MLGFRDINGILRCLAGMVVFNGDVDTFLQAQRGRGLRGLGALLRNRDATHGENKKKSHKLSGILH